MDLESNTVLKVFNSEEIVYSVKVFDNKYVLIGSSQASISIYDIESGILISELEGHSQSVLVIKILSDNIIASGSSDKLIKIWSFESKLCLKTLAGHLAAVRCFTSVNNN